MSRPVACAVLMWLSATALSADNWPQWRGPAGSGVSAERDLPERWSGTENVAWRVPLSGTGVSTPVVWDDRVFVTARRSS